MSSRLCVIVGVAALVLLERGGPPRDAAASSLVEISEPKHNSTGPNESIRAKGTYAAKVTDDVWVLVWPADTPDTGYPQSDNAREGQPASKRDGEWHVRCGLLGPPQNFDIAVYTASKGASAELGKLFREWTTEKHYPGLKQADLPKGLTEQHRITFTKTKRK